MNAAKRSSCSGRSRHRVGLLVARPSAGGARGGAGSGRPRSGRRPSAARSSAPSASARSAAQVAGARTSGRRPPRISCWVWTKNSISRMPPRPTLRSWPATRIRLWPRCALICRLIEWMSRIAAKSRWRRHRNGRSQPSRRSPTACSPADHARLDQRRALPVLAMPLVVLGGILDRQRERLARRMRPQAQVDAEHVALLRALLEQVDQRAGQAHGERHRAVAPAIAQPLRREQDDQVEVARVVQLERAELAHAEHRDPAARLRIGSVGDLDLAALRRFHAGSGSAPGGSRGRRSG